MIWFIPNALVKFQRWLYAYLKLGRLKLPSTKQSCSGWKDADFPILSSTNPPLPIEDKILYFQKRMDLIFFHSMDQVFLKRAPAHYAINGPE
jgi:hypothetical protein